MQAVWICETKPTLNTSESQAPGKGCQPVALGHDDSVFRELLWHRDGVKTIGSQLFWRPGHFSHLRQPLPGPRP